MEVLVFNQQTDLEIDTSTVSKIIERVLLAEGKSTDEVDIYFVTTEEISRLHQEFFNDPSPTDCISFPMDEKESDEEHHLLGEIFVCPQTAINYILKSGEGVNEDSYRETTLYIVHGLLHLLGYDDLKPADKKKMREAEKRHMQNLILEKTILSAATTKNIT